MIDQSEISIHSFNQSGISISIHEPMRNTYLAHLKQVLWNILDDTVSLSSKKTGLSQTQQCSDLEDLSLFSD